LNSLFKITLDGEQKYLKTSMYMTGGMPAIEITDLTKSFNSLRAVDRLNLNIDKGQIFGLLGPNGAGKTTTIRMLTGLLKPDNGTIRVLSMENWEWKKNVGYIPEEAKLYEHLTVYEHLYFVGKLRGLKIWITGWIFCWSLWS
jgi:ABC-type multidrug transport system, ATPase component